MSEIPPEGDEYNARRQEELHAAVANKAHLSRRYAEMVRDGAPLDQISALVDAIAQIDREIPHISKDLAVSVQGRNLTIFLDRMDASLAANTASQAQIVASIQISIDMMMQTVQQALDASKASTARTNKLSKEVDLMKRRLDRLEARDAK